MKLIFRISFFMLVILFSSCSQIPAADMPFMKGFNITEDGDELLEVHADSKKLSHAQQAVLEAKRLGANHIIFNPRSAMIGPYANELIPIMPQGEDVQTMTVRMIHFLNWVHAQGLTIQIRPILFVVTDMKTLAPYTSMENGKKKNWYHGNIEPKDPNLWFDSLKTYHDIYLFIAKHCKIEYYTLGAELYSMTVGIEGEWPAHPYGFPKYWNQFLDYARKKVLPQTQLMYDVTFTDDTANATGNLAARGGEFERWRYRLVDLAPDEARNSKNAGWYDLKKFWSNLDAIGIDMYRSLATREETIPANYDDLVKMLKLRSDRYATQLTSSLMEIEFALDTRRPIIFKEVGFRSSEKGFINPFAYDSPDEKTNLAHQAAAYEAFLSSFFDKELEWLKGIAFWDIGLNPMRRGVHDNGFTPLGKKHTEKIIQDFFKQR